MSDDLLKRMQLWLMMQPPPGGRTFHGYHPETLMGEAYNRIQELEAALRKIADGPRDAEKSYAELFVEVCMEARAALGEKKDD